MNVIRILVDNHRKDAPNFAFGLTELVFVVVLKSEADQKLDDCSRFALDPLATNLAEQPA
jgi:hypothetical protein